MFKEKSSGQFKGSDTGQKPFGWLCFLKLSKELKLWVTLSPANNISDKEDSRNVFKHSSEFISFSRGDKLGLRTPPMTNASHLRTFYLKAGAHYYCPHIFLVTFCKGKTVLSHRPKSG